MSLARHRGVCSHCGHDHDADQATFEAALSAPSASAKTCCGDWRECPFSRCQAIKSCQALSTPAEGGQIPEGCTPTDAMVLREANGKLAEENHALRRCLRFYANGGHYMGLIHWEGPSGDDNWLCPPTDSDLPHFAEERREFIEKLDEAMVEDGSVARGTLVTGKFEVDDPDDEPKVVKGEPEWHVEQLANAPSGPHGGK